MPDDAHFGTPAGRRRRVRGPRGARRYPKLNAELPPLGPVTRSFGTTFVETPAQLSAACTTTPASHSRDHAVRGRTSGVLERAPKAIQSRVPEWGLHALDINLTLGNLVDLVEKKPQRTSAATRRASAIEEELNLLEELHAVLLHDDRVRALADLHEPLVRHGR